MKKCPFCAEQIQDDAIKCRYCFSMLTGGAEPSAIRAGDAMDAEVRELARAGRKIQAIKRLRDRTGLGLKEAKEYVERLEPGGSQRTEPGAVVAIVAVLLIVFLAIAFVSGC